ncbi:receptor-like protein Cf-9 homolog [Solanum stenotomum]|uniref:receptor-like protein Cf-9 homolog n=1 Tax=Solanum stenotomum TaxID=172797 RepID=UPI0020D0FBBD|nr:receptor-like protein Cf-9 homolog [Solanum stenotomum]
MNKVLKLLTQTAFTAIPHFVTGRAYSAEDQNDQLSGYFPKTRWNSSASIAELFLSGVNLSDNLPESLGYLTSMHSLYLNYCNLRGTIPESLSNLTHIEFLILEGSLSTLRLAACEVKEIEFLRSAKKLSDLDLSNNKLQGRIPDWAWSNWMFSLGSLNISQNMLTSEDSIPLQSVETLDLRSNLLQGSLPIPPNSIRYFFISHNNLSEEIPSSICNLTSLVMLDLARNNLKESIPQCLGNISRLEVLDMHRNNLFGTLPTIFTIESSLRSLNLHGNILEGKIPRTLANCKDLQVLDIGDNHLIDTFPTWLGTLSKLQVLSLRSNKLHGHIRTLRSENMFLQLRIIDLSYNAFTGNLPTIATKGLELELVRILTVYTTIDLSSNNFEGDIPSIMGDLIALRVLNFSHNRLQGEIPQQLASLTFLASLDLSHNHLQGCIPQGSQFDTFENNSYEGNDGLRGFPVSKGSGRNRVAMTNYTVSGLDDQESNSEFLSDFLKAALMGYGSGLCIELSIIYFMISTRNLKWLVRIIENLERKIIMRRRRKERSLRNYRRRNKRV